MSLLVWNYRARVGAMRFQIGEEDILDSLFEGTGDPKSKGKCGIKASLLQGDNGPTRHPQLVSEALLGPPTVRAKLRKSVPHSVNLRSSW